jgi:hypothetical protein
MELDLDLIDNSISYIIQIMCISKLNNNKLRKIKDFINSEQWKKIHDLPNSYDILNLFMSKYSKHNIITDNNLPLYNEKQFKLLTNEQKEFIHKVDKNKGSCLFKMKNLFSIYIGTELSFRRSPIINIIPNPEEYQERINQFLEENNITNEDELNQFLEDNGITQEDIDESIEIHINNATILIDEFIEKMGTFDKDKYTDQIDYIIEKIKNWNFKIDYDDFKINN